MIKAALAFALLGAVSRVSAHAASPLAVAVAVEQFKNAKITPDVFSGFSPTGLLTLNYTETVGRPLTVGQEVSRSNVTNAPVLLIRGTEEAEATAGGPFNVTTIRYTVLCIDGNTAGSSNPNGYNLHYLENNLAYGENHDHTVTLNSTSTPVVAYAGPNPPSGSGPHRYIWLAYAQPSNFTAPSAPAPGSGVALFNLTRYTSAANLGGPIAGTYFTVQEGPANASVAATTAVDSTTLPQYTPTSSGGASATSSPNAAIKADWAPGVMALAGVATMFHEVARVGHIARVYTSSTIVTGSRKALKFPIRALPMISNAAQRKYHSFSTGGLRRFATLVNDPLPNIVKEYLTAESPVKSSNDLPPLEQYIYGHVRTNQASASLNSLYEDYKSNAGCILDTQLPYEPRPNASRRAGPAEDDGVVLVAHIAVTDSGRCKVSLSSGFALAQEGEGEREQCVVTCCHTLKEITRTIPPESLSTPSGIYVFSSSGNARPIPVTGVLSSLPRHDILLLSVPPTPLLRTLPLSPYPAPEDSPLTIRVFSSAGRPELQGVSEWVKWLDGYALYKWVVGGKVLGYRDLAGRESKAGTYDALSHMLFNILPTPGSSGAPLVDEYGAVVGMALGTRMDNRVEGNRGWGVPAELIFEMFSLPGIKFNKK